MPPNTPPDYSALLPKFGHAELYDLNREASFVSTEVEIFSVKDGLRDAGIIDIYKNKLDKILSIISENDLILYPLYNAVSSQDGFSHSVSVSTSEDPDSIVRAVVTKDIDMAKSFKKLMTEHINAPCPETHIQIGKFLGYPRCCVEKFPSYTNMDPVYEIYNASKTFYPDLFMHIRYFGFKIIPWFPCSFGCEESLKLSKKYIEVMDSICKRNTRKIRGLLEKPCTWTTLNCQVEIRHEDFLGYTSSYYSPEILMAKFNI